MTQAPSTVASRLTWATRRSMIALLVYGTLKSIALVVDVDIFLLSSSTDPLFGLLLVVLGGFWTATSITYARASKRSEAKSKLYETVFDHPEDAFSEGRQTSKNHFRRALILGVMGVSVVSVGIAYLLSITIA